MSATSHKLETIKSGPEGTTANVYHDNIVVGTVTYDHTNTSDMVTVRSVMFDNDSIPVKTMKFVDLDSAVKALLTAREFAKSLMATYSKRQPTDTTQLVKSKKSLINKGKPRVNHDRSK